MPLITLCGFPCVGKSKFAAQLASQLELSLHKPCVVVNEEALHLCKPEHYKSAAQEKILRQNLKSAVEHALTADTVVIFDSCNYIKGYRYELYCIARSQQTPHCVVHVSVENEVANKWNDSNAEDLVYDTQLLEELRRRFEAPNESNRWDKPLFQVNMMPVIESASSGNANEIDKKASPDETSEESSSVVSDNKVSAEISDGTKESADSPPVTVFSSWKSSKVKSKEPNDNDTVVTDSTQRSTASSCFVKKSSKFSNVYFSGNRAVDSVSAIGDGPDVASRKICDYFLSAAAPPPSAATNTVRHSSANLLYQIDKVSQTIVQSIITHFQKHSPETPLVFKEYSNFSLTLPRRMSMAELQRHRRQYIKVNSQHPPESAEDVGKNFLQFLLNQS